MANVAKDLAQIITQSGSNKTGPYDTQATVKRVEGNKVWVSIPGGIDETPIDKTVNCSAGDKVQVRVSGGRAWITGNASAPPTDDRVAIQAQGTADVANVAAQNAVKSADNAEAAAQSALSSAATAATAATNAQNSANAAQASATNANEYATRALNGLSAVESVTETLNWITAHGTMTLTSDVTLDPTHVYFVVDPLGDYDVGGTHYSLVIDPDVNDIGTYYELSIDESLNNYVGTHLALDSEGLWLLPASSGTNKVLIATGAGSTYTTAGTYIIDSGGALVASFRADGATMSSGGTQIAHLGYGAGTDSVGGTSNAPYYTLGTRTGAIGNYSVVEGYNNEASKYCAHAEGRDSNATGMFAHAEGYEATASGQASHAENIANAYGLRSHAENFSTANGDYSHSQGYGTYAGSDYQTVLGKYNVADTADTYAAIVGNGTANNARSNALTVDWSGNVEAAGDIEDGTGNVLSNKIESSYLAVSSTSIYSSQSISGSGYVSAASHSLTPPDNVHTWKALSVAGWYLNQHNVRFSTCYIDGDASVYCGLHNDSTSTLSVNLTIYVLWVRTA